jgi:hypothetical protein
MNKIIFTKFTDEMYLNAVDGARLELGIWALALAPWLGCAGIRAEIPWPIKAPTVLEGVQPAAQASETSTAQVASGGAQDTLALSCAAAPAELPELDVTAGARALARALCRRPIGNGDGDLDYSAARAELEALVEAVRAAQSRIEDLKALLEAEPLDDNPELVELAEALVRAGLAKPTGTPSERVIAAWGALPEPQRLAEAWRLIRQPPGPPPRAVHPSGCRRVPMTAAGLHLAAAMAIASLNQRGISDRATHLDPVLCPRTVATELARLKGGGGPCHPRLLLAALRAMSIMSHRRWGVVVALAHDQLSLHGASPLANMFVVTVLRALVEAGDDATQAFKRWGRLAHGLPDPQVHSNRIV